MASPLSSNDDEVTLWEREEAPLLEIPLPYAHGAVLKQVPNKTLLLRQYCSDDNRFGIHSCVWDSGIAFLHFLVERHNTHHNIDFLSLSNISGNTLIIDFGAGTGVVGLGMSIIFGCNAVLTDLPEALDLLNENLLLNEKAVMRKDRRTVEVLELSWGGQCLPASLVEMMKLAHCVIVLGSDVVYKQYLFDPLLTSLRQIFDCRPDAECLLGSQSIRTHLAEFYERAEAAGFHLSLQAKIVVPEGIPSADDTREPTILWVDDACVLDMATNASHNGRGSRDKRSVVEIVKVSVRSPTR